MIEIKEVQGAKFSLCKVSKGDQKSLREAMDKGAKLIVTTAPAE